MVTTNEIPGRSLLVVVVGLATVTGGVVPVAGASVPASDGAGTVGSNANAAVAAGMATAVATQGEGTLSVEPSGLFLGEVAVGSAGTAELTVANTGEGELTVEAFRVGGRNASMFSVDADTLTLAPGEERSVTVRFAPTSEGPKAADLVVSASNGETVEVGLVAAASGPNLVIEPRQVDFGTVGTGTSATRTVTISNDGSGPITLEDARIRGADGSEFGVTGFASGTLEAGASREVTVEFAPSAAGQQTARLVVETDNDAFSQVGVQLRGAVNAPEVRVRSRSLQFGDATVDERIVREFAVRNTGDAALRIEDATVDGGSDVFTFQQSTPLTIAPGSERALSVAFEPDEARSFSGTLRLETNDPDEPTVPIWLTNTDTTMSMQLQREADTTRMNASVRNVEAGQQIAMNMSDPRTDDNVTVTGVGLEVERSGNFSVELTASDRPRSDTPEFDPAGENGTEPLNYLNISHSIPNEDIAEATVRVSVRKNRIDGMGTTDPEDVQLYRYEGPEDGYVGQNTTFVGETETHYVYRAVGDGFSEWATGAKQAQFEVVQADVSVSTIAAGDSVNINVRISNTGGADGDFLTELLLDGEIVETRDVGIAAGGTAQVTFDREFGQPGDYGIRVNDFDVGEVTVSPEQAGSETTGGGTTSGSGDAPPIVVVALVVSLALLGRAFGASD